MTPDQIEAVRAIVRETVREELSALAAPAAPGLRPWLPTKRASEITGHPGRTLRRWAMCQTIYTADGEPAWRQRGERGYQFSAEWCRAEAAKRGA